MNRTIRFTGFVLASLTISTVAMAQQGGGRGGEGGGAGNSGDMSVLEVLRQDAAAKARLTRAVERRGSRANCLTAVCAEPPPSQPPSRRTVSFDNACAGGKVVTVRRNGQIIRYFCEIE